MRKLHINGQEWSYLVGKRFITIRNTRTGKKVSVEITTLTGHSWEHIRNARENYCVDCHEWHCMDHPNIKPEEGMVRPSQVKSYIEKHLLA
jgi:nitrate/TMAO reductase-like tetraheme cytochrome c subunit